MSLIGELDNINLVGGITAHGKARVTPLEVDYSFDNLQVKAIPDEIIFLDDSIFRPRPPLRHPFGQYPP